MKHKHIMLLCALTALLLTGCDSKQEEAPALASTREEQTSSQESISDEAPAQDETIPQTTPDNIAGTNEPTAESDSGGYEIYPDYRPKTGEFTSIAQYIPVDGSNYWITGYVAGISQSYSDGDPNDEKKLLDEFAETYPAVSAENFEEFFEIVDGFEVLGKINNMLHDYGILYRMDDTYLLSESLVRGRDDIPSEEITAADMIENREYHRFDIWQKRDY